MSLVLVSNLRNPKMMSEEQAKKYFTHPKIINTIKEAFDLVKLYLTEYFKKDVPAIFLYVNDNLIYAHFHHLPHVNLKQVKKCGKPHVG